MRLYDFEIAAVFAIITGVVFEIIKANYTIDVKISKKKYRYLNNIQPTQQKHLYCLKE
jgi:hypothetical protein